MNGKSRIVSWGLSIIFLLLTAGLVYADNGFYLDGAAGRTMLDDGFSYLPIEDESTAVRIGVGMDFGNNIAVEGSFYNLGEFGPTIDGIEGEVEGGAISALFNLPLTDNLSASARVGMFFWESQVDSPLVSFTEEGEDLFYGVGLKANISDQFALTGEWDRFEFDDAEADVLFAGFQFKF